LGEAAIQLAIARRNYFGGQLLGTEVSQYYDC
jgi:hypothetical protein